MKTKPPFYETSDMGTIAMLEMFKFPIREIKREKGKSIAVFDRTDELEEAVNNFNVGLLEGNLFDFADQLKKTKHRLLHAL